MSIYPPASSEKQEFKNQLLLIINKRIENNERLKLTPSYRNQIIFFRPDLEYYLKTRYDIQSILYCFINDINASRYIKYHIYYGRIISITSKDIYEVVAQSTSREYISIFFKYGFDIIYPELAKIKANSLLRDYIIDKFQPQQTCPDCGINLEYNRYCNKLCNYCRSKRCSERMKLNNPNKIISEEQKVIRNNKLSIKIKDKILSGEFTPCVTNSWAKSRTYINDIPFRSTWEAYFYLLNSDLNYEYTRIQYIFDNKNKIYITDFTDSINNIIYEIKPDSEIATDINQAKFEAINRWCIENNYRFVLISNEWFKMNYNEENLKKVQCDTSREKMRRNLKQFS
jgi:hypothetical protein